MLAYIFKFVSIYRTCKCFLFLFFISFFFFFLISCVQKSLLEFQVYLSVSLYIIVVIDHQADISFRLLNNCSAKYSSVISTWLDGCGLNWNSTFPISNLRMTVFFCRNSYTLDWKYPFKCFCFCFFFFFWFFFFCFCFCFFCFCFFFFVCFMFCFVLFRYYIGMIGRNIET